MPDLVLALAPVVVPTLAVVVAAVLAHRARLTDRAENRDAHAGIVTRIDGVEKRLDGKIEGVDTRAQQRDDAHRAALESVARDVSFMAGRQAERDNRGA